MYLKVLTVMCLLVSIFVPCYGYDDASYKCEDVKMASPGVKVQKPGSEVVVLEHVLPRRMLQLLQKRINLVREELRGSVSFFLPFSAAAGAMSSNTDNYNSAISGTKSRNMIEKLILEVFVPKLFADLVRDVICRQVLLCFIP